MITTIAVIGTTGTGKTTLVKKIEKELHRRGKTVGVVTEVARSCPYPINEDAEFYAQRWILHQQILKELENKSKKIDIALYDRCIIDNLVYTNYLLNQHKYVDIVELLQLTEIVRLWVKNYDYIILMPLNPKYLKEDGVRSTDLNFAKEIDILIRQIVKDFNIHVIKYRKNFNINNFCDKFSQRKKVRVIDRKRR